MADEFVDAPGPTFVDAPGPKQAPGASTEFVDAHAPPSAAPTPNPAASPIGNYVSKYDDLIVRTAKANGVDPNVMRSLHFNENASDNPNFASNVSAADGGPAYGLDQMQVGTFTPYAPKGGKITDPEANLTAASRYMAHLIKKYDGDLFQAYAHYNEGENAKDINAHARAYAKQAMANLSYLESLGKGDPTPQTSFKPKPPPKTKEQENAAARAASVAADLEEAAAGKTNEFAHKAAVAADVMAKFVGTTYWKSLSPQDREGLTKLAASTPAKNALTSLSYVSQMVGLSPSLGDAVLRSFSGEHGDPGELSEFGKQFIEALKDPKHGREIMAQMNARWEPLGGADQAYWVTKPGIIGAGAGKIDQDNPLSIAAGLYATVSQQLFTMPQMRNLLAFGIGWVNPANRIPGLVLGTGVKVGKGVVQAAADANKTVAAAKKAYTKVVTKMPMGDRFYQTHVNASDAARKAGKSTAEAQAAGVEAVARHADLVRRMAHSQGAVTDFFVQGNKFGGGIVPGKDDKALHKYHEQFYNQSHTAHVKAPGSPSTLHVDPVTKALVMKRGGKLDAKDYADHLDYAHVRAGVAPQPVDNLGSLFPTGPGGAHEKQFYKELAQGNVAAAVMQHPSAVPAEATALEAYVKQTSLGLSPKQLNDYRQGMAGQYLLGLHSRELSKQSRLQLGQNGQPLTTVVPVFLRKPGAGAQQGAIIYGYPMNTIPRDHTPMGDSKVTVDARAYYTQMGMQVYDDQLRASYPQMAKGLLDGSFPRGGSAYTPGYFKEEPEPEIPPDLNTARAGGGLLKKGHRIYDTLEEGHAVGRQENPDYVPLASLVARYKKVNELLIYADSMMPHLEEIDYEEATRGIVPLPAPVPGQAVVTSGAAGKKLMGKAVSEAADKQLESKYGMTWGTRKTTPQGADELKHVQESIMRKIQARYEQLHPDRTWNTEDKTGIDDFEGFSLPNEIVRVAQDVHPAFAAKKGTARQMLMRPDDPETLLSQGMESLNAITRDAFMSVEPYHIMRNIVSLAFTYGELTPVEISQGLLAPHTVDPRLFKMIEDRGLTAIQRGGAGAPGTALAHRMAMPEKLSGSPNRNQYQNIKDTPKRIKAVIDSQRRVMEGKRAIGKVPTFWHILQGAYVHGDKYAMDTVFGIHEDAFVALVFNKMLKKGYSPQVAAHKLREFLGERENTTDMEKGLQKYIWFYNWFKTQMRYQFKQGFSQRSMALQGGVNTALNSAATNDTNDQSPDQTVKYGQLGIGQDPKGNEFEMSVAPPMMNYMKTAQDAMLSPGSLVYGDPTAVGDFWNFTRNHLVGQIEPQFRPWFDAGADNTWDLGMNGPKVPKSSSQQVWDSGVKQAMGTVTPTVLPVIEQIEKDPMMHLGDVFGFPTTVYQRGDVQVAKLAMTQIWKGNRRVKGDHGFEAAYYAAGKDPQRQQAVLKAYEAACAKYIKILQNPKQEPDATP